MRPAVFGSAMVRTSRKGDFGSRTSYAFAPAKQLADSGMSKSAAISQPTVRSRCQCFIAPVAALSSRPRLAERGVADAILETDPVDAMRAAAGVAVAKLNSPLRRLMARNIA